MEIVRISIQEGGKADLHKTLVAHTISIRDARYILCSSINYILYHVFRLNSTLQMINHLRDLSNCFECGFFLFLLLRLSTIRNILFID